MQLLRGCMQGAAPSKRIHLAADARGSSAQRQALHPLFCSKQASRASQETKQSILGCTWWTRATDAVMLAQRRGTDEPILGSDNTNNEQKTEEACRGKGKLALTTRITTEVEQKKTGEPCR
jgi:hypothetical protein